MTNRLWMFICVSALAGCGGKSGTYQAKAKIEEPKLPEQLTPQNTLPVAIGNQWVYSAEQTITANGRRSSQKAEIVWKMTEIRDTPSGKRIVLEVKSSGKVVDRQVWQVDGKGLYQVSIGAGKPRAFTPPLPVIEFPATEGKKFSWKGTTTGADNKIANISAEATVQPVRLADTARDPVSAVPVESVMTYAKDGSTATTTAFFAPKVGLVRLVTSQRTPKGDSDSKLVLKSFRGVK